VVVVVVVVVVLVLVREAAGRGLERVSPDREKGGGTLVPLPTPLV
jgi:hypothetical protein